MPSWAGHSSPPLRPGADVAGPRWRSTLWRSCRAAQGPTRGRVPGTSLTPLRRPWTHPGAPRTRARSNCSPALTPALTLTLTRCASHGCPLQLPTGDHPAPLQLLRERMGTLLQQHASSGCRGVARCTQRGQSALAKVQTALAKVPWPWPAAARCSHPPLQTPTRFARGFPLGPRGEASSRGCRRGAVAALWYVRPRRRPHRLWPCRCRLPFAGESGGLLLLGCGTCGVIVTVV